MEMKHCGGCDTDKPLSEFNFHKSGREIGKPRNHCKKCACLETLNWKNTHLDQVAATKRSWKKRHRKTVNQYNREYRYKTLGIKPASENKSCSLYLGCVIAETVLSQEFPGFVRMPNNNPDYDYECPKGFKIDVKSSCRYHPKAGNDVWHFHIGCNKKAHFFLCIAWKDRKTLIPEHLWLIPGEKINTNTSLSITDSPKSLANWSKYERPLDNVLECCNQIRGG